MARRDIALVGCGQLGLQLAARLTSEAGAARVVATTTTPERRPALRASGAEPFVLRLDEEERLHAVIASCRAVVLTVAPRGEASYRETYLAGVEHLARACAGTSVSHIVYTSATSVYGQDDGSWVDEDSPTEPRTDKGRVLLAAEHALLAAGERLGITTTVLRLTGLYGPERGPMRVVRRLAGQPRDDGDAYLNLVHEEDVVRALLRLVERPYAGVLDLNDDRPTTRREYYDRLFAAQRLPPISWVEPSAPRRGKRVRNERIKRVLDLRLLHPRH